MASEIVNITLNGTPSEIAAIKKGLSHIVGLPAEDRNRLFEIAKNPKALKELEKNWTMLKLKIMVS